MFYANNSKSHTAAEIYAVAKRIAAGEKGLFLIAIDTGTSGMDDIHIHETKTAKAAIKASISCFADHLDVSIETIESYQNGTNAWSFSVMTKGEIETLINQYED